MNLSDKFCLDPQIHFLNHGSFGATPREVLDVYNDWVIRMENQPVKFLGREFHDLLRSARIALSQYLNCNADNVVYLSNATHGVNLMARSIPLHPGDEVLTTNQEYGACENVWISRCAECGAAFKRAELPLPYESDSQIVDLFWQAVTEKTKVIFLSHITSATAIPFPVKEICRKAREAGIISCIDGAHAPGQIPVDLQAVGADFYTGNCHKWMSAPKGSAFLYANPYWTERIIPTIVSWGYPPNLENVCGIPLIDYNEWLGTDNPCAALSVPAAIRFMKDNHWEQIRNTCHHLLKDAMTELISLSEFPDLYPDENAYVQMAAVEIPSLQDTQSLKTFLYDRFRVEVPVIAWNGRNFIRISVQGYNTPADLDALIEGFKAFRKESVCEDRGLRR